MTYQPTTRLLAALELLQARGSVSGAELAARLEVDRRSVRRYVVSLQDLGIPVEGVPGPGGGYRLRPGSRMTPLLFTGPEAIATTLGLLATRRAGPRSDPGAVEGALSKLERVLPETLRQVVEALDAATVMDAGDDGSRPDARHVAAAAAAAHEARSVRLTYRAADGRVTRRVVDPYGIAATLGHWYVVGWCHLRHGIRSFRLDRVVGLESGAERFEAPTGFDVLGHLTRGIATMPSRHVLEVEYDVSPDVLAERVPPAYAVLEPIAGGTLARYPADDLDVMASYLVSLHLPFRVRAPSELRVALRRLADRVLAATEV